MTRPLQFSERQFVKLLGAPMFPPLQWQGRLKAGIIGRVIGSGEQYQGKRMWLVHFFIAIPETVVGCTENMIQIMPHDEAARVVVSWDACVFRPDPNYKRISPRFSA